MEPADVEADNASGSTFLLRFCVPVFEMLRARREDAIDVYLDGVSTWERLAIRADIPVPASTHTLLIRIPGVVGMPHLGLEIEALRTPRRPPANAEKKRTRKEGSGSQGQKRLRVDEAQALAYLAEFDNKSRSSSVETWHPDQQGNPSTDERAEIPAGASGSTSSAAGEERAVLGQRNGKKLKVENAEVKLNWLEAEIVENGQTIFDLTLLYGDE